MIMIKDYRGMTLLEMIVAVAIFTTTMLMATTIFKNVVEGQRSAIASQNIQESMRFVFEIMGKEIRTAQQSNHDCEFADSAINKVYNLDTTNPDSDTLYFKNKDDDCVYYYLLNDALMINRGGIFGATTPDEVKVSNLKFIVVDDAIGAFHSVQPRVTMKMEVEMAGGKEMHKQPMVMQTTVSSRYYE
jgi:prepilin-type N-terminal cleavage/methylation domain-containing protein